MSSFPALLASAFHIEMEMRSFRKHQLETFDKKKKVVDIIFRSIMRFGERLQKR